MTTDATREPDEFRALVRALVHDLRNPLAAIVTNLEFARRLVAEGETDTELDEVLSDSAAACDVLRLLVANLDALSREGVLPSDERGVDPGAVLVEVAESMSARARLAEISLAVSREVPRMIVPVSRRALAVVIENLLANALQHAPRGTTVEASVCTEGGGPLVVVRDRGGAIPNELWQSATTVAGQLHGPRDPRGRRGRGASLLVARLVAEANGLSVRLAGDGATSELVVVLPGPSR